MVVFSVQNPTPCQADSGVNFQLGTSRQQFQDRMGLETEFAFDARSCVLLASRGRQIPNQKLIGRHFFQPIFDFSNFQERVGIV